MSRMTRPYGGTPTVKPELLPKGPVTKGSPVSRFASGSGFVRVRVRVHGRIRGPGREIFRLGKSGQCLPVPTVYKGTPLNSDADSDAKRETRTAKRETRLTPNED